jgi:hypothetical protein
MSKPKHVSEVMTDMFRKWPTPAEAKQRRIAARNKHMPKICKLLDIEFKAMRESA